MDRMRIEGIEIEISRKKMKNMYLRVKAPDGRVCVSAPKYMKDATIEDFIYSKMDWIRIQQRKMAKDVSNRSIEFKDGELHYLWGKPYTLKVIHLGDCHDVYIQGENLILNTRKDSTASQRQMQLEQWYRNQFKLVLPKVLHRWEAVVGKTANECRIKKMKTRWGTCNIVERRVWMNLELVKRSPECLDYVMVHELTHLYERGHGPRFKAYMDQFYPEWRAVKRRLNESLSSY